VHLVGSFYETSNFPLTFQIHIVLIISMNAEAIVNCCDCRLWVSNFVYFPSSSVPSSLLLQIISFLCFINKPINKLQRRISTKKCCPYGQHFFVDILCYIHIFCPQKTHNVTLFYRGTCIQGRRHLLTAATSTVMRIPIVVRH
jgi:hypothetical protein